MIVSGLTVISVILSNVVFCESCQKIWFDKIGNILHPKTSGSFLLTTTSPRVECAAKCERKTGCWSFYHNPSDDECFLASRYQTVVPDTTFPDTSQNRFELFRKPGGYATCKDLLQSNPSATDGDYWLYPTASLVYHNTVKVYCENMASGQPKEYITLPRANSGEYPNETYQKCRNYVSSLTGCPGNNGIYTYGKIKIDPSTMIVTRSDRTFVTGTGKFRDYGWAGDCYSELDNVYTCGPKGTFTVNTLETGLIVDPALTWKTQGYKAKVVMVKSNGDAVISLTCGGYPGNCIPKSTMYLHLNPADAKNPASATWLA